MSVFINKTSVYFTNEPVFKDEMETYLGQINGQKSKSKSIIERRDFDVNEIDYFLPYISSYFSKPKIYNTLEKNGIPIPYEKWFTNLKTNGNVGFASIYMMIDELMKSGRLKKVDKLLMAVPDSSRFSYAFGLLTVC